MSSIPSIGAIQSLPRLESLRNTQGVAEVAGVAAARSEGSAPASFKDYLLDSLQDVNSMQKQADLAVENLMSGGEANPAEVLTAVQKADLAFRMMMQIRNKLVQAYDEVKNIRV